MKLSTTVLVGGESRRMGRNKSFLPMGETTFIKKILGELAAFDETLISVRTPIGYEGLGYPLVVDEVVGVGPLGGIYSSLKQCQFEHLFVCGTDMPMLQGTLVSFMAEFISSDYDCFVVESEGRLHPLCAIYKKTLLPTIKKQLEAGDYRLMSLLGSVRTKIIPLSYSCFDPMVVSNVNHWEEFQQLEKFIQAEREINQLKLKQLSVNCPSTPSPALFCVSGVKNSGKTTLIIKLIKAFKSEGYRVGVIKHDGHEFEMDHEGTDTYAHHQAGSKTTIIYSKTKMAMIKEWSSVDLESLLAQMQDLDVIIMEGLKQSSFPKIEVIRKENSLASVCDERHVIAFATNGDFTHNDIPVIDLNNVSALMSIIKQKINLD